MTLRPIAPSDFELVCHHRESMFRDMGREEATLEAMREPFRVWLRPRIDDGSYFGFVAEDDGESVAGVGLLAIDWPPHSIHPALDRRGYVLNVYVEPTYRRQGIARKLMERAEEELRARGLTFAVLHAADAARPLYESMGWTATAEMSKRLTID